jgi:hypothetical protein
MKFKMSKNNSVIKISFTILITLLVCTIAAMYSKPNSGHAVTTISKTGGVSRHSVLLGLNENKYVLLVTGTVKSIYSGNVKIILEGEPKIDYQIYSRYPPELKLGIHKFYDFENNTIKNITAGDKFILTVCIKPINKIVKESKYNLKFYDLDSNKTVLSIPIIFKELNNFNISKEVRRPEIKVHEPRNNSGNHKKNDTSSVNKKHHSKECCDEK